MFFNKKNNIYYCENSKLVSAWQFTAKNFKKGIPEFIKANKEIIILNINGKLVGEITYPPSTPPNTSDKYQKIPIPIGSWIIKYYDGVYDITSDSGFKYFFSKVDIKEY